MAIAVAPASAAVTAGGTLAFHATLLDGDGNELPGSAYTITWLPSAAWVEVTWQADGDAMILANGGFGPGTVTVELRAEAGGATSPAVPIQITETTAPAATGDRLIATAATGVQEHAALVSGTVAGTCQNHVPYSFPVIQILPSHTARCADDGFGEVAFFSPETRMDVRDVGWTAADDVVDLTAAAGLIVVPVAAWVAVSEDVEWTKSLIEMDLTLASALMEEARAGVTFALLGGAVGVVPGEHIHEIGPGCFDVQLADALGKKPQQYVSGVLNLYYVETVLTAPDQYGNRANLRGETCWRAPGRPEDLILMPTRGRLGVMLAHELGHALGLAAPRTGHVNGMFGIAETNLMYDRLADAQAKAQGHLTLGQGYRVNTEVESWINRGSKGPADPTPLRSGPTRACSCDPYAVRPCPPIYRDLGSGAVAGGTWESRLCYDNIELKGTNGDDQGYVVLDGMRWRDRFACSTDVVGTPGRHWGTTLRAYFPKLVPVGACPSRATAFLTGHAMEEVEIEQSWGPGEGEVEVDLSLNDPLSVPVHLWIQDGAVGVEAAVQVAKEVFGEKSLTGVVLDVETHQNLGWSAADYAALEALGSACDPAVPWPQNRYTDKAVNVYVQAAGTAPPPDGGYGCSVGPNHFLFVVADGSPGRTLLTHHLGHAMGLDDLPASSVAPNNLMWAMNDASAGGSRLTLGQIHWLNRHQASWIQRAGLKVDNVNCVLESDPARRCIGLLVDRP